MKKCAHDKIMFQSADYYVACEACGSRWAMLRPGQMENAWINGEQIGTAPELSNRLWPAGTDPVRKREGA